MSPNEFIRLIEGADIIEPFNDGIRILVTDAYNGASSASFDKEVLASYDIQYALAKDKVRRPHKHVLVNRYLYKPKDMGYSPLIMGIDSIPVSFLREVTKQINLRNKKEKEMSEIVVDRVIFNDPVTVVMWHYRPTTSGDINYSSPQKTVVYKQEGETFDPEKGLAMAFSKILFENKGSYYDQFKKWLPKEEAKKAVTDDHIEVYLDSSKVSDALYSEPAKKRKLFGGRK